MPVAVEAPAVASMVQATIPRCSAVLEQTGVDVRPVPDRWSPLEYACHVRDVFRSTTSGWR